MIYRNIYVDGVLSDITVSGGMITSVAVAGSKPVPDEDSVDFHGERWALPGMVNMHTHSAMTLLRSEGSGLPLQRWLNEAIFPHEAKLTSDDIYTGALEACLEMKESGTTAFNDMYFCIESTVRAAHETGICGNIALSVTDQDFDNGNIKKFQFLDSKDISTSISPHSIYAVNVQHLKYLADFANEHDTLYHIHLSETQKEREDCIREHGVPPVVYLDQLGVLDKVGSHLVAAHSLWLDKTEIQLLGEHRATVVHCPNSNLKLGSGCRFLYTELRDAGVNVTLGTDGCASSDNLDMVEAMKVMSLLQKGTRNDPSVLPAEEVFQVATKNGYRALRLDDAVIKEGHRANFFLVDISKRVFKGVMDNNINPKERTKLFLNRFIYAAHGDAVTDTFTAGNAACTPDITS